MSRYLERHISFLIIGGVIIFYTREHFIRVQCSVYIIDQMQLLFNYFKSIFAYSSLADIPKD
jgi:hypothetical protein